MPGDLSIRCLSPNKVWLDRSYTWSETRARISTSTLNRMAFVCPTHVRVDIGTIDDGSYVLLVV